MPAPATSCWLSVSYPPSPTRAAALIRCADEFQARSPDELTLARGDRIELIERDDDFGDGWFLGKNTETGDTGLFPEGKPPRGVWRAPSPGSRDRLGRPFATARCLSARGPV